MGTLTMMTRRKTRARGESCRGPGVIELNGRTTSSAAGVEVVSRHKNT